MPSRSRTAGQSFSPLPILHFETWVTARKNSDRALRLIKIMYTIARKTTREGGGTGPWVFIVGLDSRNAKGQRLRKTLDVDPGEGLWAELAFYPDRARIRSVIKRIWNDRRFRALAQMLDPLVSKRKHGRQDILSIASLQPV